MLPTIKKLLYATDLSPDGPQIFRYAAALAKQYGAKIIMLHALEPLGPTATSLVRNVVPTETLERLEREGLSKVRDQIHQRLQRFCDEELGGQAQVEDLVDDIRIVEGAPATVIVEQAQSQGADVIVMGMHGYTALERMLLGSVANKVVQQCRVPVLLVPVSGERAK